MITAHRRALGTILLLVGISSAITALLPWPLKLIVDHVLKNEPVSGNLTIFEPIITSNTVLALVILVALGLFLQCFQLLTKLIQSVLETSVAQQLRLGYGETVLEHLQSMSLTFHDENNKGDLVTRVTSDTRCIEEFVLGVCLPMITSIVTLILMFLIMVNLNKELTLIALCAAVPIPFLIRALSPSMTKNTYAHQEKEGERISIAEQTLSGLPMVQAFGQENKHNKAFRLLSEGTMTAYLKAIKAQLQFSIGVNLSTAIGTALMMLIGGQFVINGNLTLGELIVFLAYVAALYGPVETLAYISSTYAAAKGRLLRVSEILDQKPDIVQIDNAVSLSKMESGASVEFQNISFHYQNDHPILNDISLSVSPCETIAFVGSTGSGKSTLLSLVPRFFDTVSGNIKINGVDIKKLDIKNLRSNISIVLQDPYLLPVSVAENIAYGKPNATVEQIKRASKLANAHEFIEKLPQQYDTVLSEQASNLSGGQKQRIALARALLKDSPILILDEPTSALDAGSESLFIDAMKNLRNNRTTFIIAHRLSTIKDADKIVVMDEGKIVEIGTEKELLSIEGGFYQKLAA